MQQNTRFKQISNMPLALVGLQLVMMLAACSGNPATPSGASPAPSASASSDNAVITPPIASPTPAPSAPIQRPETQEQDGFVVEIDGKVVEIVQPSLSLTGGILSTPAGVLIGFSNNKGTIDTRGKGPAFGLVIGSENPDTAKQVTETKRELLSEEMMSWDLNFQMQTTERGRHFSSKIPDSGIFTCKVENHRIKGSLVISSLKLKITFNTEYPK